MLLKKILKGVSLFLIVCILSGVFPLSALAAEVGEVVEKLTPKQKEEIKSMISEPKEQKEEKTAPVEEKVAPPEKLPEKEVKELKGEGELSKIEQGFLEQVKNITGGPLKQFGYDVFDRAVGSKFALIPSIPIGPDYRINPGDKLLVTIWGNANETFDLTVDERGTVAIPKVGVVQLAGYSLADAKEILYERLANVFIVDFNIDLTIKEIGPIKIYLLGEFVNPGAYTVLANTSLYDAIFTGGGATRNGSLRNIELVRNGITMVAVDLYDFVLTGKKKNDVLLKSGDVIRGPAIGKVVAISGNVRRPGIYELKARTELSDFIGLAGGITPTTYLQRIQIERRENNRIVTAIDVNYADYLKIKSSKPAYLGNLDYISVFSIEPTVRNVVYLSGNVIRPDRYELNPGMRLMDLIVKAEGLAPDTYLERAQIYRTLPPDMRPAVIALDLNKMKAGDSQNNPVLQEFDRVRIFSRREIEGQPLVYVSGELNDGDASFPLVENMRVSDLIYLAGGIKESAYLDKAELARTEADSRIYFYALDLNRILKNKDKSQDMLLKKNDYFFVRRIPDYGLNETAVISGEVKYPGRYAICKEESLSSLIERAGGYTNKAFLDGALFIRESLKAKQAEDQQMFRNELEGRQNWELARLPVGLSAEDVDFSRQQINKKFEFSLKKLQLEIPGRIIIDLPDLRPGNEKDIILQNGDCLKIPEQVNGVTVMGEVYFPGTILYEKGKSVGYYIDSCGGGNDFADTGKILVLRASGKVEKSGWYTSVRAGDTILMPSKPIELTRYQKPFDWGAFWDVSLKAATTVTQVATSLVTVYLLYKSIQK